MNSPVKQRLINYIKHKGISIRQFCLSIGASPSFVANIVKSIQPDKINSIANQYPDLNTGWLLTGEGKMLKEDYSTQTNPAATQMEFDFNRWMINEEKKTACLQELTNTNSRLVSMLNQAMSGKNESMQNQIDELSRRIERFLESLSQRRAKDAM